MFTFEPWFCCLNPAERSALRSMALAYVAGMGEPVPALVWQAFWLPTTPSRAARMLAFMETYFLVDREILEDGAAEPAAFVAFDNGYFWSDLALFLVAPESACLTGCKKTFY